MPVTNLLLNRGNSPHRVLRPQIWLLGRDGGRSWSWLLLLMHFNSRQTEHVLASPSASNLSNGTSIYLLFCSVIYWFQSIQFSPSNLWLLQVKSSGLKELPFSKMRGAVSTGTRSTSARELFKCGQTYILLAVRLLRSHPLQVIVILVKLRHIPSWHVK